MGASASSMSPLMKVAMALAEALISSWALETDNLPMSSSRALRAFEFSALTAEASCKAAGAILQRECGSGGGWEEKGGLGPYMDKGGGAL